MEKSAANLVAELLEVGNSLLCLDLSSLSFLSALEIYSDKMDLLLAVKNCSEVPRSELVRLQELHQNITNLAARAFSSTQDNLKKLRLHDKKVLNFLSSELNSAKNLKGK